MLKVRRLFYFTLNTALIALAVGGGWVGYEAVNGAADGAQERLNQRWEQVSNAVMEFAYKAMSGVEANPTPVLVALGMFLLTFAYHKLRGASFRTALEVAATRVQVVAPLTPEPAPAPSSAASRAQTAILVRELKARQQTCERYCEDQIAREESLASIASKVREESRIATASAEAKKLAVQLAEANLEAARKRLAEHEAELTQIDAELVRLDQGT